MNRYSALLSTALWLFAVAAGAGCSGSNPEVVAPDSEVTTDYRNGDMAGDARGGDASNDQASDLLPPSDLYDLAGDLPDLHRQDVALDKLSDSTPDLQDIPDAPDLDGDLPDSADTADIVTPMAACSAVSPNWVQEVCDAASVVVWDGEKCIGTCPGCCGCEPFCELTFSSLEECTDACMGTCPTYNGALATEPFQYFTNWESDPPCRQRIPRNLCTGDWDCPIPELGEAGQYCVQGNCVFCWNDSQCGDGEICRMGRCVASHAAWCPSDVPCSEVGCHKVMLSETGCPVCICDSVQSYPCEKDEQCQVYSFHPFQFCVYGRCADCRQDSDCGIGEFACHAPGICSQPAAEPHRLWGTWLIGWYGALNHYSYFRFEPDGTLRRGHYVDDSLWSDDIPPMPCWPEDGTVVFPYVGTWELLVSATAALQIRISLNTPCDLEAGYEALWTIDMSADASSMSIALGEGSMPYEGMKVPTDSCSNDFSLCTLPGFD